MTDHLRAKVALPTKTPMNNDSADTGAQIQLETWHA